MMMMTIGNVPAYGLSKKILAYQILKYQFLKTVSNNLKLLV